MATSAGFGKHTGTGAGDQFNGGGGRWGGGGGGGLGFFFGGERGCRQTDRDGTHEQGQLYEFLGHVSSFGLTVFSGNTESRASVMRETPMALPSHWGEARPAREIIRRPLRHSRFGQEDDGILVAL
ncbi:MAG: hypothetical protein EP309_11270 [Gammaproteobacteria bacterium]|nr:MAG: hypothetical protein EP309_11270 [Gammaproteobacteria bacterium]